MPHPDNDATDQRLDEAARTRGASAPQDATDQRLDQALGHLLRGGVVLAGMVVLLGGVAYLLKHWDAPTDNHVFREESEQLRHPAGILRTALALDPSGIIQLGVLLLIATPVARVIFTVFAFGRQRDWAYVVITLIVLSLLLFGLFREA